MSWTLDALDRAMRQMVWKTEFPREGDQTSSYVNQEIRKLVLKLSNIAPELVTEPIPLTDFVSARVDEDAACPFAGAAEYLIGLYEHTMTKRKAVAERYGGTYQEGTNERKMRLVLEGIAHQFSDHKDYARIQWVKQG